MKISEGNGGIDRTGDENNGQSNSEGDLGNKWPGGEQSR
jgi:hypothetical protein